MRKHWLYAAMAMAAIGFCGCYYQRVLMALAWLLLYHRILERRIRQRISMLIMAMLVVSIPIKREIEQGRVMTVRDNYIIVRQGFSCALIYTDDENVGLDDVIRIDCDLSPIESYDNFDVSTFSGWAFSQQIYYQGSQDSCHVLKKGASLRRLISDMHKGSWIDQLLTGWKTASDSDYRFLITSSGMHLSFLISLLRKIYGYYDYPDRVLLKTINSVIILGLIFRFPFGLVRILLSLLAELFLAEGRDRTGFVITILALYRPWMVCSTSFLIPLGLRFMNLFIRKQRRVATSWLLITVQLYFYGYCDLVSVLSFGLFRSLSGIMYGLALVCSFMPWRFAFDLSLILSLREKLPVMMLNGRISLLVIALGWVFIYHMSLGGKERYFVLLALLLVGNHYQSIFHPFWEVTFLDVGQGDCAVISRPFSDCGLLIDTGGNYYKDVGNDLVIPYLRSRGLNMVDVIISHDDYDHSGALGSLVRNYRVGRIYIDKEDVSFGNLTVRALLPEYQWEESNDNSLINYFTIDSIGFLFTGDISETVEEELTQQYSGLKVTVLKVAHHGSALSTGTRLLSEIRPYFAVISAGRNNRYGHPAAETLQRLADWNVRVFNTQNHHAVRFTVIKHMMIYRCAGGLAGIFLP